MMGRNSKKPSVVLNMEPSGDWNSQERWLPKNNWEVPKCVMWSFCSFSDHRVPHHQVIRCFWRLPSSEMLGGFKSWRLGTHTFLKTYQSLKKRYHPTGHFCEDFLGYKQPGTPPPIYVSWSKKWGWFSRSSALHLQQTAAFFLCRWGTSKGAVSDTWGFFFRGKCFSQWHRWAETVWKCNEFGHCGI